MITIIAFCSFAVTALAIAHNKYIVKFNNDDMVFQKQSDAYTNHDIFYEELQLLLGTGMFVPINNYSNIFDGVSFSSPSPGIINSIKSLNFVEHIWADSVHTIKNQNLQPQKYHDVDKQYVQHNNILNGKISKRGIIPAHLFKDEIGLKYKYGNQTKYYHVCLKEYTPYPPKPKKTDTEECKNYYINGWETPLVYKTGNFHPTDFTVELAFQKLASLKGAGWGPFANTYVDKVHEHGYTGKNIVIGFLDTGVDAPHPALKDKFIGGYDLIGDNYNGYNTPEPDEDPNDTNGHGTEVAGIALGKSPTFTGVAPDAKFIMYRIFNSQMVSTNEIILNALEKALKDKVDIISISASEIQAWQFTPFSLAIDRIVDSGTIVVFAAGNGGSMGPYYATSGSASNAITVGSVQSNKLAAWPAYIVSTNSNTPKAINYISTTGNVFELNGVYDVDYFPNSLCGSRNLPAITNNILLVSFAKNTKCSRDTQYNIAAQLGYQYVFFVESNSHQYTYNTKSIIHSPLIGAATIPCTNKCWLSDQHFLGSSFKMIFNKYVNAQEIPIKTPGTGLISPSSAWGPTYDGFMAPDIAAPGANVFSTGFNGTYLAVSGTSFSCPYIAGIAALYLEKHGFSKSNGHPANSNISKQLKRNIIAYAKSLKWYSGDEKGSTEIAPHIQQGAGLVDAFSSVMEGKTFVEPSYITTNSSHDPGFFKYFEITVTNQHDVAVSYDLDSTPALVVNSFDEDINVDTFPPLVAKDNVRVYLFENQFMVSSGSSKVIKIGILFDSKPIFKHAIYSGKIHFTCSRGNNFSIPYLAFGGNAHTDIPIFTNPVVFGDLSGINGFTPSKLKSHVFRLNQSEYPAVFYSLDYGTLEYSLDLVYADFDLSSNFTIEAIYPSSKNLQKINKADFSVGYKSDTLQGFQKYYGPLASSSQTFPISFAPRFQETCRIIQLATGEELKPGKYRILQRGLRPYGNRFKINDWQVSLSDEFTIV